MKQIGTEIASDWPIKAHTLREILYSLGFKESKTGEFVLTENLELLDTYPMLLEDDGMGYGINPKFVVEVNDMTYSNDNFNNETVFNLFIGKQHNSQT